MKEVEVKKCVLCGREAELRTYIYRNTWEEVEIPLCKWHYGCYMAHGIKRLDQIMEKRKEAKS
jgi:hypothetical protein